jgi:thiol:disulfide interchange protein DsbC
MRNQFISGLAILASGLLCSVAVATELSPEQQAIKTAFETTFPELEVTDVLPTPVEGLQMIAVGAEIFYVSADGEYLIAGDMYAMDTRKNLTDVVRNKERYKLLETLTDDNTILFAAEDAEYTVTVFTDIDCGYCRKLHREMATYNDAGISIRYAFFPRSGPDTESWAKAEAVWCADSRQEALTASKGGEPIEGEACDTPVAEHYELVNLLGLRGTPALFTDAGEFISGYVSADELLDELEDGV